MSELIVLLAFLMIIGMIAIGIHVNPSPEVVHCNEKGGRVVQVYDAPQGWLCLKVEEL